MTLKSYWTFLLVTTFVGITLISCKRDEEKVSFHIINEGAHYSNDTAYFSGVLLAGQIPEIKKFGLSLTNTTLDQTSDFPMDHFINSRGNFHLKINGLSSGIYVFHFYAETPHGTFSSAIDTSSLGPAL